MRRKPFCKQEPESRPDLYPKDELLIRYQIWASLPSDNQKFEKQRQDAWNFYCDVRDNVPLGTSYKRSQRTRLDERQMALFDKGLN